MALARRESLTWRIYGYSSRTERGFDLYDDIAEGALAVDHFRPLSERERAREEGREGGRETDRQTDRQTDTCCPCQAHVMTPT
eukprot:108940-Rhodomonas_salina.1